MKSLEEIKRDNAETRYASSPLAIQSMTLLDYFAGQVLMGCAASRQDPIAYYDVAAKYSYSVATEMLKEREKWDHETGERKG